MGLKRVSEAFINGDMIPPMDMASIGSAYLDMNGAMDHRDQIY